MKTILYQPLFINPQAYFVFPQLYHIEKGDSYIEPANITGQLIINNLSEGLTFPEYDFHIIAMGEQVKVIKNWSPLTSISTFGFRATDNQIEFAGSTDGGTMSYILDDTDVTKFTIEYTNTAGEGNVYLMIGDKQYDVISGQLQTYSVSGSVKLEFLNQVLLNLQMLINRYYG